MRHAYIETTAQDPTDDRIQGDEWNADHVMPAIAEPDDPALNTAIQWMSDGTGLGDEGDIMVKINFGGVVKYAILVDFSAATNTDTGNLTFGTDPITFGTDPLGF